MKWMFISDKYRGKVIMSFPCPDKDFEARAEKYNNQHMRAMDIKSMFRDLGIEHSQYYMNFIDYIGFMRETVSRFYIDVVVPLSGGTYAQDARRSGAGLQNLCQWVRLPPYAPLKNLYLKILKKFAIIYM